MHRAATDRGRRTTVGPLASGWLLRCLSSLSGVRLDEPDRPLLSSQVDGTPSRLRLGVDPAIADDPAGGRPEAERLGFVRGIEDDEVRRAALLHPRLDARLASGIG